MRLREQVLHSSGAGEGHDVHRVVARAGEGVRRPARNPSEVTGFGGPATVVELKFKAPRDHEESLVHRVVAMENRAQVSSPEERTHTR
jgi:hypothetical protein